MEGGDEQRDVRDEISEGDGAGGAASSGSQRPLVAVKDEPQELLAQEGSVGVALALAAVVKAEAVADIKEELVDASDGEIDAHWLSCRSAFGIE